MEDLVDPLRRDWWQTHAIGNGTRLTGLLASGGRRACWTASGSENASARALHADLAHLQGLQRVGRDLDRGRLTTAMRAQLADWHAALVGDPVLARQLLRKLLPERLMWHPPRRTAACGGATTGGGLWAAPDRPAQYPRRSARTPIARGWHESCRPCPNDGAPGEVRWSLGRASPRNRVPPGRLNRRPTRLPAADNREIRRCRVPHSTISSSQAPRSGIPAHWRSANS